MPESIVAAALRFTATGLVLSVPRPGRHGDVVQAFRDLPGATDDVLKGGELHNTLVLGFLTSEGRFVNREEGWEVAKAAGQPRYDIWTGENLSPGWQGDGSLQSEDVWPDVEP